MRLQKRVLIVTGSPGIGKTTVLTKTVGILKKQGHRVGGMLSREVRESGVRVGFEILDVGSGSRGWLAQVNLKNGPQVGKYRVNVADLNSVGAQAITQAVGTCQVVVIDEIGPMELFSLKFKEAVRQTLENGKWILAVLHWKAQDQLITEVRNREDAEEVVVNLENREKLPELLAEKANAFLRAIG